MITITNKKQMYELYGRGVFGNRLRSFETLTDLFDNHGDLEVIGMRYADGAIGGSTRFLMYDVPIEEVRYRVGGWVAEGADYSKIRYSEMAPKECALIQGEVQRTPYGLELTYSTVSGMHMREALRYDMEVATGLKAKYVLEKYLDPSSFDDLMNLLDTYGNAEYSDVVEFSCYSRGLGVIPHRNCVIWEVRGY